MVLLTITPLAFSFCQYSQPYLSFSAATAASAVAATFGFGIAIFPLYLGSSRSFQLLGGSLILSLFTAITMALIRMGVNAPSESTGIASSAASGDLYFSSLPSFFSCR